MSSGGVVETWTVRKPVVESRGGLVASQHHLASDAGARVLAAGGNAVDAAVAAGIAIGAVEPWMSGLGGGGFMLVYRAAERDVHAVEFPMRAPLGLEPSHYPLVEGADNDLFGWPAVRDDRNVFGPASIMVPGFAAGMGLALERFGSLPWRDAVSPALELARAGLVVDWYASLKIAAAAATLARYPESARVYLPGGFVPAGEWGGPMPTIALGNLASTLERLADAGADDFYRGEIAARLVEDARECGSWIRTEDLAGYAARITKAPSLAYRGATVHGAPAMTAGPSLHRALSLLSERLAPAGAPDAAAFEQYARALQQAYSERLARMGDDTPPASAGETCTTHLSVVDERGNMVALTQTLLSVFGSKVMLPRTGLLMNNGVMWFDPRPERANSIAPGKLPLSNMCPTIVERGDGLRIALGASGGRRIMPAVFQLTSLLVDFGLPLEEAVHHPRIDASGTDLVTVDPRLPSSVRAALARSFPTEEHVNAVYPVRYACPNLVTIEPASGATAGAVFVMSPWSKVSEQTAFVD